MTAVAGPSDPAFPTVGGLLTRQVRYQVLMFWRTPIALFFTIVLPLMMLVLFNLLFGGSVTTGEGELSLAQYYTGGLAAFTAVSATFTNLANMVPIRRDEGVLKRWRGTPLPTWAFLAGLIGAAIAIAAAGVVLMLGVGLLAYDIDLDPAKVPALVLAFVVGVGTFAMLGLALAGVVPTASSAAAAANAIILPLAFVSNVFIAVDDPPAWLDTLGDVFPLKPFVEQFQAVFDPGVDAPAIMWGKLAYVAAWGVLGALVARRSFRWEPAVGGSPRGRRSRREPDAPA